MLLQVDYRFAFVLFLAAKTTDGAENSVFFQIEENKIFSYGEESLLWSGTGSLLSCSVLCMRQASCSGANFLEKAELCYLLRDEMQTSSATGRLLQRDGSFYLKKVFHINFFTCYSFRMTTCDHFSIITTQKTVGRFLPSEGRLFTAKLITFTIISREKNSNKFNFSSRKLRKRPERLIKSAPK